MVGREGFEPTTNGLKVRFQAPGGISASLISEQQTFLLAAALLALAIFGF